MDTFTAKPFDVVGETTRRKGSDGSESSSTKKGRGSFPQPSDIRQLVSIHSPDFSQEPFEILIGLRVIGIVTILVLTLRVENEPCVTGHFGSVSLL